MDVNLREEFDALLEEYGHDIIYVRRVPQLHCRCWNEQQQSGNPKCASCFGTGYVVKTEIHKTRSRTASAPLAYPELLQSTQFGVNAEPNYFFYMKWNSSPTMQDLILDVEWRGNRPGNLIMPYQVNFPEPLRGQGGRIEYWRVGVEALSHSMGVCAESMKKFFK